MCFLQEITCYSLDNEHKFHADARSIKYYYPAHLGSSLSNGFSSFQKHDDSVDEHLDFLLRAIIVLERQTSCRCKSDIVTWRGMLTKILTLPFDKFAKARCVYEIFLSILQGKSTTEKYYVLEQISFIEECHAYRVKSQLNQKEHGARQAQPSQELMSFWGYKFEILSLLPETWDNVTRAYIEDRESMPVSNEAQYCSVVKTAIGKTKMILGGEIDGVWDKKSDDVSQPTQWVELKTSASITSRQDSTRFERKLLKFWAQSFLLGVPRIIVGFRSDAGILESLEEFSTEEIPNMVAQSTQLWDGNTCINFASDFLQYLKSILSSDSTTVWRIQKRERSPCIEIFPVEGMQQENMLSEEFLDWRRTAKFSS